MHTLLVTFLVSTTVLWIGLFGTHALAMRREGKFRNSWGAACIATLPALIPVIWLTWDLELPPDMRNIIRGFLGAVGGVALAIWLGYLWDDWRAKAQPPGGSTPMSDKPSPPSGPSGNSGIVAPNNSGIITQGQTGNNTVINQAPGKLQFSDALGAELLAKIPNNKLINLMAVGSPSDQNVGLQIAKFLQAHGYQLSISIIGMMAPPPDRTLVWDAARSELIVAPSAR
jgi:hypothetical protein